MSLHGMTARMLCAWRGQSRAILTLGKQPARGQLGDIGAVSPFCRAACSPCNYLSQPAKRRNDDPTWLGLPSVPVAWNPPRAYFSTDSKVPDQPPPPIGEEDEKDEGLTVFQRFKKAYKEHGKVLIGVHVATSAVWFSTFFYAAHIGVDIIPLLEKIGLSERIISPFRSSSVGDIALAYLMYKLATPARYTVTLGGTNYMIKYLRKKGRMPVQEEKLRDLYKDSKQELQESGQKISSELKKRRLGNPGSKSGGGGSSKTSGKSHQTSHTSQHKK